MREDVAKIIRWTEEPGFCLSYTTDDLAAWLHSRPVGFDVRQDLYGSPVIQVRWWSYDGCRPGGEVDGFTTILAALEAAVLAVHEQEEER